MTYAHAPQLTALKSLPQESHEWDDLLQPYRDQYADIPEIMAAAHPRAMLLALYSLTTAILRGEVMAEQADRKYENYSICADHYHALYKAVHSPEELAS